MHHNMNWRTFSNFLTSKYLNGCFSFTSCSLENIEYHWLQLVFNVYFHVFRQGICPQGCKVTLVTLDCFSPLCPFKRFPE